MDRTIVYPGALPQDTDILSAQNYAMTGLGYALRAVFGTAAFVDGLIVTPTIPASMSVMISEGSITQMSQVDTTAFGSMPVQGDLLMKMGVNTRPVFLNLASPLTVGQAQNFLIQVAFDEHDDTPIIMPYYNAAQPTVAFAGPGNSNVPQNTRRVQRALISVKPGVPATTGTQVTPTVDAGYLPLYVVTLNNGQIAIAGDSIASHQNSPAVPWKLPQLAPGFSRQVIFTTSSTWQVPVGVRIARVRLVGAGGGGGGGNATSGGGGGGAGGYAESIVAMVPSQIVNVTVGAGGLGSAVGTTANIGGPSAFGFAAGGEPLRATGGTGGQSANPNSSGGQGGAGVAGGLILAGGFGTDGAVIANVPAGSGGASAFGGGGRGSTVGGAPANGQAPGSGAGGGYFAVTTGGTGAPGFVLVDY